MRPDGRAIQMTASASSRARWRFTEAGSLWSCLQSKRRGVARTYQVFDTPAICGHLVTPEPTHTSITTHATNVRRMPGTRRPTSPETPDGLRLPRVGGHGLPVATAAQHETSQCELNHIFCTDRSGHGTVLYRPELNYPDRTGSTARATSAQRFWRVSTTPYRERQSP